VYVCVCVQALAKEVARCRLDLEHAELRHLREREELQYHTLQAQQQLAQAQSLFSASDASTTTVEGSPAKVGESRTSLPRSLRSRSTYLVGAGVYNGASTSTLTCHTHTVLSLPQARTREETTPGTEENAFMASLRALAEEHNASKHGGELHRLRTENAFLTKRAMQTIPSTERLLCNHRREEGSDGAPSFWLPSTEVEGAPLEATAAQMLQWLERVASSLAASHVHDGAALVGHATRFFWKLVGSTTLLQQRLVAARAELEAVHRRADQAEASCRCVCAEGERERERERESGST
jgi:hypothetical protein